MVSPSLPLLISLSSYPSLFLPPSSHCSGQLPSITVTGRPQHRGRLCMRIGGWGGRGGKEGRRRGCVYGCDERRRQLLTYQRTVYVYRCVCMCVAMRGCFRACVFVWYAHGAISCHTPCCCSNGTVTTAVWHLWRINIFHLEWSYYLLLWWK